MKVINKNNGRLLATGRFETSKVSHITITRENGDFWIVFQYLCDNLIEKTKAKFPILYVVTELNIKDNFVNLDACDFETTEISAEIQLTVDERERFFVYIIKHILSKYTYTKL